MGIMTRKRVVDNFYAQLDRAFDEGYKEFANGEIEKIRRSNDRLKKVLASQLGSDFVSNLNAFLGTMKASGSFLSIVRSPKGVPVMDRRFTPARLIWFEPGSNALGSFTMVGIQIKDDRWLQVHAYH